MKHTKNTIGKNIKRFRKKLGISQERLSKNTDLSLNTVVTIESGVNTNPTIDTLTRIAQALGVGVDDLIK